MHARSQQDCLSDRLTPYLPTRGILCHQREKSKIKSGGATKVKFEEGAASILCIVAVCILARCVDSTRERTRQYGLGEDNVAKAGVVALIESSLPPWFSFPR